MKHNICILLICLLTLCYDTISTYATITTYDDVYQITDLYNRGLDVILSKDKGDKHATSPTWTEKKLTSFPHIK